MPTYDYECTECGHAFEAFQRMSDAPLSSCPQCRGRVRRLIGGGMGVIFKGSGFYTTDYRKGSSLAGGNGSAKDTGATKSGDTTPPKAADSGTASPKTEKAPVS